MGGELGDLVVRRSEVDAAGVRRPFLGRSHFAAHRFDGEFRLGPRSRERGGQEQDQQEEWSHEIHDLGP
jgi:hypothetical protein